MTSLEVLLEVSEDKPTASHVYPATWVDAFKLRFFPTWLLRRYPHRVVTVTVVRISTPVVPRVRRVADNRTPGPPKPPGMRTFR